MEIPNVWTRAVRPAVTIRVVPPGESLLRPAVRADGDVERLQVVFVATTGSLKAQ